MTLYVRTKSNKTKLDIVLDAIKANGNLSGWTCKMHLNLKWHARDRLILYNEKGIPKAYLFLKLRSDGVGIPFGLENFQWSEATMKKWDEKAVVSCLIVCAFSGCVSPDLQRRALDEQELENYVPLTHSELKYLQSKIRKNCAKLVLPLVLTQAVSLLKKRYLELDSLEIKEKIQELSPIFRFLLSKNVPFSRIHQAWDEAKVSEVMEG